MARHRTRATGHGWDVAGHRSDAAAGVAAGIDHE